MYKCRPKRRRRGEGARGSKRQSYCLGSQDAQRCVVVDVEKEADMHPAAEASPEAPRSYIKSRFTHGVHAFLHDVRL